MHHSFSCRSLPPSLPAPSLPHSRPPPTPAHPSREATKDMLSRYEIVAPTRAISNLSQLLRTQLGWPVWKMPQRPIYLEPLMQERRRARRVKQVCGPCACLWVRWSANDCSDNEARCLSHSIHSFCAATVPSPLPAASPALRSQRVHALIAPHRELFLAATASELHQHNALDLELYRWVCHRFARADAEAARGRGSRSARLPDR